MSLDASTNIVPEGEKSLLQQRIIAVLNTGSGSCDVASAGQAEEIFRTAGLPHAKVISVGPDKLEAALDDAVANCDLLVVLGGDGTIGAAASRCGASGSVLVPLPGGTMNMLPRALYGERPWREALADTLANPQLRNISGGKAEDRRFFCVALLGAPSLWANARESLRKGDLVAAAKRSVTAARRSLEDALEYRFGDDVTGSAEAVAVICPLISRALDASEPMLEAAALDPETAGAVFGLAFHAAFDDWRNDTSVSLARVKTVSITGHGGVPVMLDGETVEMGRTVKVSFVPLAFRALVPRRGSGRAKPAR